MDYTTLADDWDKMVVEVEVNEEKSVRINISLSDKCYEAIDFYKETVGLSTGRTDFIVTAIKYLYFDTMERLDKLLSGEVKNLPPREQLRQMKSLVADRVESGYGASKIRYEGSRGTQSGIYVSERVREALDDLVGFSGHKVGEVILAAIAIYHQHLSDQIILRNKVIQQYNAIRDDAKKAK